MGLALLGRRGQSALNFCFGRGRQASRRRIGRIQFLMRQAAAARYFQHISLTQYFVALLLLLAVQGVPAHAQDSPQGPMTPPPEHHVTRVGTETTPGAPPDIPEAEIVKRFSQKEDEYIRSRAGYTYRKTIRIQEFGADGQPAGEFVLVTQPSRDAEGKLFEKVVERPQSSLRHFILRSEDLEGLQRVPAFPLTSGQLAKYDLKYLGKEQVDEIDCYIFQAKPKVVERIKAYFDGIVWVDAKYLEVVKTYGRWVTDQGDMHAVADLPFSLYETYRENVDGKFWFPNYSRSDGTVNLKGLEIPVRLVIKWTDFKSIPNAPQTPVQAAPTVSPKP
jgi:hypothetical protein